MLEQAEAYGHASIVRWQPHGRAFKIYDKKRFEKEILPLYFNSQTKFGSFQRQLNMYSFLRLARPSRDQKAYYHPQFLRGRPSLSGYISRGRTANNKVRRTYDASTEPDFDKMIPVSWQSVLPIHTNSMAWGPLPIVNQATKPIAEVKSIAHHQYPTSVLTPVSGESNYMVPSLDSGGITQFLSNRTRNANSSSHNSFFASSPPGEWRTMSRVISTDLQVTRKVPEATVPNVPWQGQPDHPVSTSKPVKTPLLDPNLADDVIYIFSERQAPSLDQSSAALSMTASCCTEKLRQPRTGATDASLSTFSSGDWSGMDFGACSECNADSSDWLEAIDLESFWDTDNWGV
jgi:HSF-type DNA-binding